MPGLFRDGFPVRSRAREAITLVVSAKARAILEVVLLDTQAMNAEVHFDRSIGQHGRDVPCVGMPACCYCRINRVPDPKSYHAAALLGNLRPVVLQLSDGGSLDLERLVAQVGDWRGLILRVERADARKESRVKVTAKGRFDGKGLPGAFDVVPVLERIWGMAERAPSPTILHPPTPEQRRRKGGA